MVIGTLGPILLLVVVIAVIVAALVIHAVRGPRPQSSRETAAEEASARRGRGELSGEEYERRRRGVG